MIPGPFNCYYMGRYLTPAISQGESFSSLGDIFMAQQGDEPHPHGPEDSTPAAGERAREEESGHLRALLQPPPFCSQHYCGDEGNKKAKTADKGSWLFLIEVFSLQAAWMVCNHQKRCHWKYPGFMLPIWVTSCKIMIASEFLFPLSLTSCNSRQKHYHPSYSQSLFHIV